MTKKNNSNEVLYNITKEVLDIINWKQFDAPEQRTRMSGEENPYYNKDAVFFLGGILNQIGWSLRSKETYLSKLEKEDNNTGRIPPVEASIENGKMFYDLFVNIFNVTTEWTWDNGKTSKDYGQKWFAEYKEKLEGNKVLTVNEEEAKLSASSRLAKLK
jgi:hypothetical protein